jgi:diaminohydroxyphosphoribosylaminopyrimidine deaminase/5-amino-6-(5-phosphoribosylamino)uracil reductase
MKDPNRLVAGKGIEALRKQGINVVVGVHEEACRELNRAFIRHITTGLPYVHLKLAQTLDGKIARRKGPARPITSEESRRLVHSWRSTHDAVMVGANTVIKDDPRLDVRLVRGRNPHVIILDGMLRVPPYSMALKGLKARKVYLCTSIRSAKAKSAKVRLLERKGVIVLAFPERRGQIDIRSACHVLYKEGIGILLVEGGSRVAGELLAVGLVDQLSLFVAPWALGVGVPTFSFPGTRMRPRQIVKPASVRHVGNDILLQYFFA